MFVPNYWNTTPDRHSIPQAGIDAGLRFAWFALYWQQRFTYAKFRWVTFLLACLGVAGAVWTFFS